MRQAWGTFWLAAGTVFMISLDATVVVAAFPALRHHFSDVSPAWLSWTINGYSIVFASLLVPFGRLVDRTGSQRCFLIGVTGFTLASAACALAPSPQWLTMARVIQAMAAALASPASLAMILGAFSAGERARVAGLWSAVGALGAALGPLIGSALIDGFSWPMIFLINVPVGLVVIGVAWRPRQPEGLVKASGRLDIIGTLLLIGGVAVIAGGLAHGSQESPGNILIVSLVGLALLATFFFWARGRSDAALDLRLFSEPDYRWASAATLVLGFAFGMMFLTFYLFFTGVWHFPQALAGLAATPGPMTATLVAIVVSKFGARWGIRGRLATGGALFVASNVWLARCIRVEPDYLGTWLPGQIVGGIAIGLILPTLTAAAVAGLPSPQWGVGGAVNNALRQLGSALGVASAVAITGHAFASIEAFRVVYWCLAAAGGVIVGLSIPLSHHPAPIREA